MKDALSVHRLLLERQTFHEIAAGMLNVATVAPACDDLVNEVTGHAAGLVAPLTLPEEPRNRRKQ